MNLIIDNLNSVTGWSGTASVHGLNDHKDYVAGYNTQSIVFNFDAEDEYIEKTYGTDVSDYNEFTVYLYSREKADTTFVKPENFYYKIDLGSGKEYYLPTWQGFTHITIDISSIDTIDRIRITSLHDDDDYLIMSYAVVSKDEIPLDIFQGIQTGLETYRDTLDIYLLGTINATTGDSQIDLSGFNFVEDYAVIKINDGSNDEIHQLISGHEGLFNFTGLYDGDRIINSYTDASVYLYLPIEYGRSSLEAIVPGITVWGFEPQEILNSFGIQDVLDTWTENGASERREGLYNEYPIQFDCEARQNQILAHLARIVRDFIGRRFLYVNGRKCYIQFDGAAVETKPINHYDSIPKVLYRGTIEIREELWQRTSLPLTETITLTVTIQ